MDYSSFNITNTISISIILYFNSRIFKTYTVEIVDLKDLIDQKLFERIASEQEYFSTYFLQNMVDKFNVYPLLFVNRWTKINSTYTNYYTYYNKFLFAHPKEYNKYKSLFVSCQIRVYDTGEKFSLSTSVGIRGTNTARIALNDTQRLMDIEKLDSTLTRVFQAFDKEFGVIDELDNELKFLKAISSY